MRSPLHQERAHSVFGIRSVVAVPPGLRHQFSFESGWAGRVFVWVGILFYRIAGQT